MKKHILITIMLGVSILSFSQNKFGVFGGIGNSTISDGFLEKFYLGSGTTIHFGGLYELGLTNKIVFRPKIIYSQQGDREKNNYTFIDVRSVDYKLTYLNIPLDFKFLKKPYIIFGPQIGFLLSTDKQSLDFGKINNNFDYGLNLGVGYDFNSIFIEFDIYQGFPTLLETESVNGLANGFKGTNTVLQLSIGYYFM